MRQTASFSPYKPLDSGQFNAFSDGDGESVLKLVSAHTIAESLAGINLSAPSLSLPSEILLDGTIGVPGEQDVYAISLVAGQTYLFSLYGSGGSALVDPVLAVFGSDLSLIALDDDGGAGINSLITLTATTSGTYYIAAQAYPGSGLTGGYTLDVVAQPPADTVPNTFEGAADLALGVTYGFIDSATPELYGNSFGETDSYKITVEAGKMYTFEVAGGADYSSDYLALNPGELDPLIVLYDSQGNVVASNDDISFPSDVSSRITFYATESGTYYLDVQSYRPWTGGYSITASAEEVDLADLDPLDSLIWKSADNVDPGDDGLIKVYFAEAGETFGQGGASYGWNDFEKAQVMLALGEYTKILGFTYVITEDSSEADFRLITTTSNQFGAYFFPQDPAYGSAQGIGGFNVDSGGWSFDNQQSLLQGGFSFAVILHEFGHAHGLSHPHDNGGGSDILLGVSAATDSYGVFDLNQGIYTVMSYNDGNPQGPNGPTPYTGSNIDSGWSGTLSAFDIAALQARYGIVTQYATGNNVYLLGDANDPGVYYQTIWDTGGTDEIRYSGARDAQIDLLAATIDYSPTGGGVLSFVDGIFGGYTIAKGVVIENATGGSGDDVILGNSANNVLKGNDGDDFITGREGNDTIEGGAGDDELEGNEGNDSLYGGDGDDLLDGGDGNDTLYAGSGDDFLIGAMGNDLLEGGDGDDVLDGGVGNDKLYGGAGDDILKGGAGNDEHWGGAGADLFVFEHNGTGDIIRDFQSGVDKIDLSAFGVGSADVRIVGNTINVNTDGKAGYDLRITVYGDAGPSLGLFGGAVVKMSDIVFDGPVTPTGAFGGGGSVGLLGGTSPGLLADSLFA